MDTALHIGELLALNGLTLMQKKALHLTKTLYHPRNNIKEYERLTPKTSQLRAIRIDD
jgi:hypothetical protein